MKEIDEDDKILEKKQNQNYTNIIYNFQRTKDLNNEILYFSINQESK